MESTHTVYVLYRKNRCDHKGRKDPVPNDYFLVPIPGSRGWQECRNKRKILWNPVGRFAFHRIWVSERTKRWAYPRRKTIFPQHRAYIDEGMRRMFVKLNQHRRHRRHLWNMAQSRERELITRTLAVSSRCGRRCKKDWGRCLDRWPWTAVDWRRWRRRRKGEAEDPDRASALPSKQKRGVSSSYSRWDIRTTRQGQYDLRTGNYYYWSLSRLFDTAIS